MAYYILIGAVAVQGISGLVGGIGLVADPSGDALRMPLSLLEDTPFRDYLIPGLILLVALGMCPLAIAWALWNRRPWAWMGSFMVGIALTIWITVQILLIGYQTEPPLQLLYGALGLVIMGLSVFRPVRARLA